MISRFLSTIIIIMILFGNKASAKYEKIAYDFNFNDLDSSIYLTGIKLKKKQKLNWPWYSDFKFTIYTKTYKWNMFLDKKVDIIKEYDFVEISKDLSESFNFDCENKLISDVDTTLIFKLNCN